jgi:ankyrin repeat protein
MMLQCDPDQPVDHLFQTDAEGRTLLHHLAIQGDVLSVETILRFASLQPSTATRLLQPDCHQRTPFHYLAMKYKEHDELGDVLSLAVSKGAEPMPLLQADSEGQTPLHLICSHKDELIYEFISRNGTAVETMLQIADKCSHLAVILKADAQGQTPFHLAVQNCHEETIEAIISAVECDKELARTLFARNKSGCTPLEIAFDRAAVMLKTVLPCPPVHYTGGIIEMVMLFAINNGIECKTLMDPRNELLDETLYYQIIQQPWIWPILYPSESR